jgi:hypothetical protein
VLLLEDLVHQDKVIMVERVEPLELIILEEVVVLVLREKIQLMV